MKRSRRLPVIAVGLAVAAPGSTALAQDESSGPTSTLDAQDCVTDALVTLGAECHLFTGEED